MTPSVTTQKPVTFTPLSPEEAKQWLGEADSKTGAPLNLRAAVAGARTPKDKLTTVRMVYPDARPVKNGEFVYTDPDTGQPRLFNPPGMDRGDLISAIPMGAEVVGSVLGGVSGAAGGLLSGGLPAVPGALAGSGAGSVLGREIAERGLRAAFGGVDTRSAGGQALGAAGTFAAGAAGEGAGRLISPVAKGVSGFLRPAVTASMEAGERLGIPLTVAMQTGKKFWANVEAILESAPLSTAAMGRAGDKANEGAFAASQRIVKGMTGGPTDAASFSGAVRDFATKKLADFRVTREAMDVAVGQVVPNSHLVPLPNTAQALTKLEEFVAQAPTSLGPEAKAAIEKAQAILADAAEQGGSIPFGALRKFRTTIGEASDFGGFGERTPGAKQHLQDLYVALKQDILNAGKAVDDQAVAAGLPKPGAQQAIEAHDAFVRLNRDPENLVTLDTFKKILKGPDVVAPMQWASNLVRNPARATALRKSIPPSQWDAVAGSIFQDMGLPTVGFRNTAGEGWSGAMFLKNWDKLGPKGRNALFGGTEYAKLLPDMEALAAIARSVKDVNKLTNTSNTARALLLPLMTGSIGWGVGTAVGAPTAGSSIGAAMAGGFHLTSWAAAKVLTNPQTLKTITALANAPQRLGPGIARLIAISRTDKELGAAINEYLGAAQAAGLQIPNYRGLDTLNSGSPSVSFTPR